jgi:sugar lactone lactonase YvrE
LFPTDVPALSVSFPAPQAVAADARGNIYFSAGNCVFKVDAAGVLTRAAGSALSAGYSGDGGPATSALLNQPTGVAVDTSGNLYIADTWNFAIRKVAASGTISTVAGSGPGNGTRGYSGDGGPATSAQLGQPTGVAVDVAGNLYIVDTFNSVIRKVAADGTITTAAGNGAYGYSGDGGPATSAQLSAPEGIAVDAAGNFYIADTYNCAIRKVAADGGITTVAGNGTRGYSGDGGPATSAQLNYPYGVAVDAVGSLYIADTWNFAIRKVAADGTITTAVGNGTQGYSGDGGPATGAQLGPPQGVAVDAAGTLYIADIFNYVIRKVAANGTITTVAGAGIVFDGGFYYYLGDGGPAIGAQLIEPRGAAVDAAGNLYIADMIDCRIRKVAPNGTITTVAGNGTYGYSGDGGPATSAQLGQPMGVAVDAVGNLYIADANNYVIRKVAANGAISTIAGNGTRGYSGDGGPSTSAELLGPRGLAVDAVGDLYIADYGWGCVCSALCAPPANCAASVIRKVTPRGVITTVAGKGITPGYSGDGGPATNAQLNDPVGVAVDAAGNLYIADSGNNVIRKVSATGTITTVGFGTSGCTGLVSPSGVAVDAAGNLYMADAGNSVIRKLVANGAATNAAGNCTGGYSGDGGLATSAQLNYPGALALDAAGDVYIADVGNDVIRLLVPQGAHALLSVAITQSAGSISGQAAATYSVVVSNAAGAGPTNGTVTVTEIVPIGLTLASMSGAGWSCSSDTCTRGDALNGGSSYPPIAVTLNAAAGTSMLAINQVTVSGGGSLATSASALATILALPAEPVLTSPANGAIGVAVAPALAWIASDAASYQVYFGTSSPPPLVANTTGASYAPGALLAGTTYYWQIVAQNGAGTAASPTWSFTPGAPGAGLGFVPVTPCRVADTRNAAGSFGGPTLTAGSTRSFPIAQSGCGIPLTAQAYSVNVTVVPDGPLSFLTLWPAGGAQPLVSTLNSFGGTVVANAAIVAAGSGGAVSVYASDRTDVILDINGYFDSTSGPSSSWFYPAAPCRVADTRKPAGEFGGPSLFAGQTGDFPIPLSSCASLLSATAYSVTAYSLNVTVAPDTDFLGYLTTWPTGQPQPNVSTLNSWTGTIVANAAFVPAGSNGSISAFVTDPTDVILDINGYFGQPGRVMGLSFYPVAPCRVADTRNAAGPFGGPEMAAVETRSFAIPASACNIPSAVGAYSVNVTVVPDGVLYYLTAWPTGSPQPLVSTLNSVDGSVVANAAIIPAGTNGAISVYVTNPSQVILDINGYFAP